ncbi:MAG: Type 1 glutamine amidotransferase-like domain-containing protein [Actinomycetota bacterium]
MSGPIALIGGMEHTTGCEDIDRDLMELAGVVKPTVAIVPVASSARRRPAAVDTATRYWTRLGAKVKVVASPRTAGVERAIQTLGEPDIVVLTGGHPDRIRSALSGSILWDRIVDLWQMGAGISGSSAGSMELCEFRLSLRPPLPFALTAGLGLIKGCLSAPHFDTFGMRRWGVMVAKRYKNLTVIGLDERTAIVGKPDRFVVRGQGAVTFIKGGQISVLSAGSIVGIEAAPATT